MVPGESIVRRCPSCEGSIRQRTLASGNTFGARFWTDGKMEAPMLPSHPPLVRCPHCGVLLWLPSAEEIGTESPFESETPGIENPLNPAEQDLLEALSTPPNGARDKELFIRIKAWHATNDTERRECPADVSFSPEAEANIEALFRLLDPTTALKQRIMKAELARELGRFDETKRLLDFPFEEDHMPTVRLIRDLAFQGVRSVAEVSYA
ncbi:MAG: hypothetical protein WKF95_17015 [Rubrobacter sp.]